ncbi:transmembrane [Plasmopara halstedii]|uniref:Transmembrane n=1 Tax=Plasmopara halstedii TaxID=4781 RepID=A0A0N7L8L6_PLAHL|nr:transmembrane [Plasmopara halstedii]CEG50219.1 transmembrane [Plasmopara halstedii]|eukprot:XP_024586588.1 transmembrane [Plasmopara halstedii]
MGVPPSHKEGGQFYSVTSVYTNSVQESIYSGIEHGLSSINMTQGPDGRNSLDSLEPTAMLGNNRFVAGSKFFNYQQFGALRKGGSVTLFSASYYGVLVATAQSSLIYAVLRYCMRPTLMHSLQLQRSESSVVIECLLNIPTTLSFFLGLMSDVMPISGYRRKSYMIIGTLLSFLMCTGLMILSATVDVNGSTEDGLSSYIIYYIVLIMGATFGTMLSKIATDARVIELSQREPLTRRGTLQINYLLFRAGIEWIGLWVSAILVHFDDVVEQNYALRVDPFWAYAVLALLSLVPVPFVVRNCSERKIRAEPSLLHGIAVEEGGDGTTTMPVLTSAWIKAFFRMCQQRAVWQLVLFQCLILTTTRFSFGSANAVFVRMANLDPDTTLVTNALKHVTTMASMVLWKILWLNSSWRKCVCFGIAIMVISQTFRAFMMIYVPSIRTQAFYDTLGCISGFSDGIITIFSLIPATEIAENGSEGATQGMLLSFRSTIAIAMRTLSGDWLSDLAPVTLDDGTNHLLLLLLVLIGFAVHTMSLFSVLLLPRQKLDAQQLRVYGGYSKTACIAIWSIFIVVFAYAMVVNIDAVADMAKRVDEH